jgi:hypothetical protein
MGMSPELASATIIFLILSPLALLLIQPKGGRR